MVWNAEQLANAQVIMRVGRELGASERDIQIGLMTAMQESSLRNLHYGDRDSLGLFQQRGPWGSVAERTDPATAARMFFLGGKTGQPGLFDYPQRDDLTLTQAAQKVQVSAYPDAYARHEGAATALMGTLTAAVPAPAGAQLYDMSAGAPPAAVDSDGDGLTDEFERLAGTDARTRDTDGDGLADGREAAATGTDPIRRDTDGDGTSDAAEVAAGTDAGRMAGVAGVSGDTDGDGLGDLAEFAARTDARVADTDRDDLADGLEVTLGTDPTRLDSDGDGLTDRAEVDLDVLGEPSAPPGPAAVSRQGVPAAAPAPFGGPAAAGAAGTATPPAGVAGASGGGQRFLEAALAQSGDPYVFGTETTLADTDPAAFDCSELVQWSAHQAGVRVPDGAMYQYLDLKQRGMLIPVEQALKTPGALLFSFSSEPVRGGGRPSQAHVAISLGDGNTIEARGRADPVGVFAARNRFQYAAVIPELAGAPMPAYGQAQAKPGAAAAATGPSSAAQPAVAMTGYQIDSGAAIATADTDADGLTDGYEQMIGSDARGWTRTRTACPTRTRSPSRVRTCAAPTPTATGSPTAWKPRSAPTAGASTRTGTACRTPWRCALGGAPLRVGLGPGSGPGAPGADDLPDVDPGTDVI